MKVVVFGPEQRVGALEGGYVVDLNAAVAWHLAQSGEREAAKVAMARVPATLLQFIAGGPPALEDARRAVEALGASGLDASFEGRSVAMPSGEVQIRAPWPGRRIACAGGNFAAHLGGVRVAAGDSTRLAEITRESRAGGQWGFWKVPDAVSGPEDPIPYPKRTHFLDFEGEVAIILGRKGKDIAARDVGSYIWGITLFNDWSIRDERGTGRSISYNLAKNFDGSPSLGPCIVIGELDPQNVDVETKVNGRVRQQYNTRDMIWSFAEIVEYLSRDFTLAPGDVVAGGTGVGTAADQTPRSPEGFRSPDLFLNVGDEVEVSNSTIGRLHNQVVAN